jgi:lactate dehydrogenase-like 2-hydroxyacid dehydrogenase
MTRPRLAVTGAPSATVLKRLETRFEISRPWAEADPDAAIAAIASDIRAIASFGKVRIGDELMSRLPKLALVANFGVGYDLIDAAAAAPRKVVVTNTPDVLNDEVADTAIGMLIATVREFGGAERHLRSGDWAARGPYRLTASLRGRTVGLIGMGRIGQAIAKRLEAFDLPVVYHSRSPAEGVAYRHYGDLVAMARDVDTLIVIVPGGAATNGMVNAEVLAALGNEGVLINVARGTVVDEPALIAALRDGVIHAAGLDVFAEEPKVPAELVALPNTLLLPHVGSASTATREGMAALVVDNLLALADGVAPRTPVAETPFTGWKAA